MSGRLRGPAALESVADSVVARSSAVRVRWWVGMVVRYVCEIRVPVCPRVSRPGSPRCHFTDIPGRFKM